MSSIDASLEATPHGVIFQDISNYTRVTEVLYPFSGLASINPETVKNAGTRGTRVHEICESIMKGLGDWGNDEETKPYVDSFLQWWGDGQKIIEMEKRFYDDSLGITGQVDLIIEEPTGLSIVDLKTSYKPSKTWPLQGSAYAHMARNNGYDIKEIKFLHLNRYGGPPKMYVYEDQWDMYSKCLDVFNYFFKKKKKIARKQDGIGT